MKLHLWFRDRNEYRETINWPSAPPTFRKPWTQPISIVPADPTVTPDKPMIQYIEYKLVNVLGEDAYYYATYKDVV